ncbi:LysE family translocator [Aminobacter ciceronei]|uniref:Threonine/homoserine/homoserine lactone efflux protein n=1 Tax=Aminobacter ciceronei TaxID=150723 RepID=A0ABR6CCJ4_9HYPH|nr:LysE family translocator [Aminobacter ciceronei]MBA8908907.1 threonine/homoserine/homoserine lactone efflux protein [Aminobacter ciceronei]MBA9022614.1 threonine/homoserine/homoserine lactone efflux protein [Aminobacter ciceronei]
MSSLELLLPFALATLAFACMPGPAILYMTAQTVALGRRAGLMAAFGVHIGCYVHIFAAAIGLASLIEQAPMLFEAIRLAGAAYLVWLGLSMFMGWDKSPGDAASPASSSPASQSLASPSLASQSLRDSIIVEILNPKTALFFLTFLPQFVDPAAALPVWLQFLLLGMFVNLVFSAADVAAVGIASVTLARVASGNTGWIVPKACGSILVGLGLALVGHQI